ncbi:MAG TPA: hypothetical protein VF988_01515 [Verrucomicrobiae bacterium]
MELGSEFAKGAAERVLGAKFPILMRVILPGLLATGVFYPAIERALERLPSDADHWWQRIVGYIVFVAFLGALASALNDEVYKLYEGRILWPARLFEWARKQQQKRVERLLDATKTAKSEEIYNERWYELRAYPINDDGVPEATHPTRLGNVLAGYEQYPGVRYGMDSVFFWPRIWLQIEQEKKSAIDSTWSVADGLLSVSAISFLGAAVWLGQAVGAIFGLGWQIVPLASPLYSFVAAFAWLVAGFFFYRISLPYHRANGEIFKSIFDLHREKIWSLTSLKPGEKEAWRAAWAYLQYVRLQCPNCKKGFNHPSSQKCAVCGFGLEELNRNFFATGKFPDVGPPSG